MKIGVISDSHGSLTAWQQAIEVLADVDFLLHAGDILYHGARNPLPEGYNTEGLVDALNDYEGDLLAIKGNVDALVDNWVLPYPLSEYSVVLNGDKKIVIYHGYQHDSEKERVEFAKKFGADILIFGHTHLPLIKEEAGVILLNPGSIALPKQEPAQASLAVIEDDKIEILTLDGKEIIVDFEF
ncbi:phosphodiesterase [Fuchsiella alkaliacetigena]|uniref:phosphodiesterase n=1 Tax=Fuchsiella alkaliacetigena TaxID=957042 RepID=UPI00200A50CF|nr:phosphodiesterase [Fuchsiella alkaliacetigena]MCK8823967.1 phosphodiesterase [Fuchsiella alkaliacetigena]